ncbi:acyl-CoA dehydrogenase family protein [Mycobacterium sp. RTGN5]|uniref:acyl-CoA dehydrogenase family protein n=1 Tax=Mycobacterium sp. RTGN5 TaxID=3016522 RepID=UPI0029C6DECC|nr:acyl-CoA dehydrogenase family protein [Mycobacterium sp. RTGN5]
MSRLHIDQNSSVGEAVAAVRTWIEVELPTSWQLAARQGLAALRAIRSPRQYRQWYPTFAYSGLVAPNWASEHGGLGLSEPATRAVEKELEPYNLYRMNQLGLHNAAAALFSYGTEEQRRRFLPPIVTNEEHWCQLFSEPGAGSDLASLATRAERDGNDWVVTGQKVWTTAADVADFGLLLARTDPGQPKHRGITYFIVSMRQPGVEVRPLRQITGESEFNEVFLTEARVPDAHRIGEVGDGWTVSASTLASERQMVSGTGSGGVGRLGGSGADRLIEVARDNGRWNDPVVRQQVMRLWAEEQIRGWTNARVRSELAAGQSPGPASSIGKVHQATLNQQIQDLMVDLLGTDALAWHASDDADALPGEVRGMMRSLANGTEGGTTDINKNILGERVLGLPKEPDPWKGKPWKEVPRS